MEINKFEDIQGVVVQADIVEGRFVVLGANGAGGQYFSNTDEDLPGVSVPATAELAKRANFCVTFAVDNRPTPIVDYPGVDYDFRGGWVNSSSGPLTGVKMWLTHPGNQEGQTIPSGYKALAITEATVTLPSGHYIYNAALETPGAALIVGNTADDGADAGKPKYQATAAVGVIGRTVHFDSTTKALTLRVE